MKAESFNLLGTTITPLHIEHGAYSLLEARTPPSATAPPPHRHWQTDESAYVVHGLLVTEIDGQEAVHEPGAFVRITRGQWHTFRNPGDETAIYLWTITPQGLEGYFVELAAGLAQISSSDEAQALRKELCARYDVEMQSAGR